MLKRVLATLVLLMAVWGYCARGQGYPMLHFTVADGLPSNVVYSLFRDSKGFLWIATDKGVAKYNGLKFEVFTTFNGLPDNEIYCINEDREGRVWFGGYSGSLCYYKDDSFHTAKDKKFLRLPFDVSYVRQITVEYDSSIIASFYDGNKFVEIKGEQCRYFDLGTEARKNKLTLTSRLKKKTGPNQYMIYDGGCTINVDTAGKITGVATDSFAHYNFTMSQGRTYVYSLSQIEASDGTFRACLPPELFHKYIYYTIYVGGGHVLYGTNGGILLDDTLRLLPGHKVSNITQDMLGNYWAATLGDGVFCLGGLSPRMRVYSDAYQGGVKFARVAGGRVFFATERYELHELNGHKLSTVIPAAYLKQHNISSWSQAVHYIGARGDYYMFCGKHLVTVDNLFSTGREIKYYKLNLADEDGFKQLFFYHDTFYVWRFMSLFRQPRPSGGHLPQGHGFVVNTGRIYSMAQGTGHLWYSTRAAVYKLRDTVSELQEHFRPLSFKSFVFAAGCIIGNTFDNRLVVGANAGGKPRFTSLPEQNCIWDQLYVIDGHRVLISTNNSYRMLVLHDSAGSTHFTLHTLDNLFLPIQADEIAADSSNCYFFKDGAITSVALGDLWRNPSPPVVHFTSLTSLARRYTVTANMAVDYNESRDMRLKFSVVSFNSRQLLFQYAVVSGREWQWKDFEGGELSLDNLPHGTHKIMLRAGAPTGEFSAPVAFILHIGRPFWLTWWFIAGIVCLVALAAWALIVFTRRTVLRAQEKKSMLMELELKAIYSQINPHFIFNTLNSALLLVKKQRFDEAYNHISRFSRLLRSYIRSSRNKVITIEDEIKNLTDYLALQRTRSGNGFEFEIHVADSIRADRVKIPSLLLQPFVENALEHGFGRMHAAGLLKIDFVNGTGNMQEVICRIDDNGIGRKEAARYKSDKGESYGDLLIKDLVSIFNKYETMRISITYVDKEPPLTGTTVLISIKDPHYD